jgi:hypothetical protein
MTERQREKARTAEIKLFIRTTTTLHATCGVCDQQIKESDTYKDEFAGKLFRAGWRLDTYRNRILCRDCFARRFNPPGE